MSDWRFDFGMIGCDIDVKFGCSLIWKGLFDWCLVIDGLVLRMVDFLWMEYAINWLIDFLVRWLIGWLIGSLFDCLIFMDGGVDWFDSCDCLLVFFTWLFGLLGWLIDLAYFGLILLGLRCLIWVDCLIHWLVGCLADCEVSWLRGRLADWLIDWLLIDWIVGLTWLIW